MSLLTPQGGAQGWAFHRPWGVPHSLADDAVPIVWMMAASAGYFEQLTGTLIWPRSSVMQANAWAITMPGLASRPPQLPEWWPPSR